MRYLNKVIFIESANIRYSEVKLDGNVHLIGTQGVGKSTLLRALLFFYNANPQKLGIPIEKKRFVDFYFPYQNSFIIYELKHENGSFSVLAYKSQGRVVFRFFNSEYKQHYFIHGADGRIAESWDVVRDSLSRDKVKYTKLIDRYEEYRNIIYGNNKGLGAEFRKYALLESKQYQNIPRAIQHVFLNYKVESDFIKDTIIKSLNEEEMPIDLSTYTLHLKDFETQHNDIRIWTEKPAKGENRIRKLAGNIVETLSVIRFVEQDFAQLSAELMSRLKENEQQQTKLNTLLEKEKEKAGIIDEKQKRKKELYEERKRKLSEEKGIFVNKLKEARVQREEYERLDIQSILSRVAQKSDLLREQQDLSNQKRLLETNFNDIKQRYEIQIKQLNIQLDDYRNRLQEKSRQLDQGLWEYKEMLSAGYDMTFSTIRKQFEETQQQIFQKIDDKKEELSKFRNRLFEAKHQIYFEQEINGCKEKARVANGEIQFSTNEVARIDNENSTLKTRWELNEQAIQAELERNRKDNQQRIGQLSEKIAGIRSRIENSKDSLFGWLNREYPDWEKTIGKVIDEEKVLFKPGLSPRKTDVASDSFYGIRIDLEEIDKEVRTLADYEEEIAVLEKEIEVIKALNLEEEKRAGEQLEGLRKKYLPRIKKNKEEINRHNYNIERQKKVIEKEQIELDNWLRRAEEEKKERIEAINRSIDKATVEKTTLDSELVAIQNQIDKKIKEKQKEKGLKIEQQQQLVETEKKVLDQSFAERKQEVEGEIRSIEIRQKKEMEDKGADTEKISSLEDRLRVIENELAFIEEHTELVFNYRKDEKELFNKVDYFKQQRDLLDGRLNDTDAKYEIQQKKLEEERSDITSRMEKWEKRLNEIDIDSKKFEQFKMTKVYTDHLELFGGRDDKVESDKNGITIIEELVANYYSRIGELNTLREYINKFNGNFTESNIFKFKTKLDEEAGYLQFAEDLREFIDEDKISEYEKRVNELFANIIRQIGGETEQLLSKESVIGKVISDINSDFVKRNFVGVIKSIELKKVPSSNKVVQLLGEIKTFNDENIFNFGEMNLFTTNEQNREENNKKAIQYLSTLSKVISDYKADTISLSDSFELEFRVVENDNDTGWVDKLSNVGSDGTDVLVKAMINIMLLNVFKEGATRNQFKDFRLHCMMDEIGKLHPNNARGILKFANDRNIFLVNGSPQSFDALAYKYTYKLSKQRDMQVGKDITIINRIVTNNRL